MNNIIEHKDYLFVHVSLNLINVVRVEGNKLCYGAKRAGIFWRPLPPGSWQIIGKGDAIDWEGIVSKAEITDPRGHQVTAMDSAISILLTYGMRPSTTLVLKKQTKLK